MKINFEIIGDVVDYIISNYLDIDKEISGFIKENLDLSISIGSRTTTKWFNESRTFHTHVARVYNPSIQDFHCLINSNKTKLHILITKKTVIIINKLYKVNDFFFLPPSVSNWNKNWRKYFKATGYEVYEKSI